MCSYLALPQCLPSRQVGNRQSVFEYRRVNQIRRWNAQIPTLRLKTLQSAQIVGRIASYGIAAAPKAIFLGVDTNNDLPHFVRSPITFHACALDCATPVTAVGNGRTLI